MSGRDGARAAVSAQETVVRPGAGVDATEGRMGTVDAVRVRRCSSSAPS
jgi:hypothetical protein